MHFEPFRYFILNRKPYISQKVIIEKTNKLKKWTLLTPQCIKKFYNINNNNVYCHVCVLSTQSLTGISHLNLHDIIHLKQGNISKT